MSTPVGRRAGYPPTEGEYDEDEDSLREPLLLAILDSSGWRSLLPTAVRADGWLYLKYCMSNTP